MMDIVFGFFLGVFFIMYFVVGSFVLDKRKYECTEVSIINGEAVCTKYERKK